MMPRPSCHTADEYSDVMGCERLRLTTTGRRPAPATAVANDLAAESSHRGVQGSVRYSRSRRYGLDDCAVRNTPQRQPFGPREDFHIGVFFRKLEKKAMVPRRLAMTYRNRPEAPDGLVDKAIKERPSEGQVEWLWPVLADIKDEWRASTGQYSRALLLGAVVFLIGELTAKAHETELSILGFRFTDKILLLRLLGPASGYFVVAAVIAWASVCKMAGVHHSLVARVNPYLADERLYEALVPASVGTRETVITYIVPRIYRRPRSRAAKIIKTFPNLVIDFLVPLVLFAFTVRLSQLSFVETSFDFWELVSLLVTLVLVVYAISAAAVELKEILSARHSEHGYDSGLV
jgi:hypothetical protein